MEFGIEKCAVLIMKSRKRQIMEGIELSSQEKIRTLRETETYKYLGILKADTSRDERKNLKCISGKQENFLKPNSIAGILSKG